MFQSMTFVVLWFLLLLSPPLLDVSFETWTAEMTSASAYPIFWWNFCLCLYQSIIVFVMDDPQLTKINFKGGWIHAQCSLFPSAGETLLLPYLQHSHLLHHYAEEVVFFATIVIIITKKLTTGKILLGRWVMADWVLLVNMSGRWWPAAFWWSTWIYDTSFKSSGSACLECLVCLTDKNNCPLYIKKA